MTLQEWRSSLEISRYKLAKELSTHIGKTVWPSNVKYWEEAGSPSFKIRLAVHKMSRGKVKLTDWL